jgi:dihydrofolate reductase
LERAVRRIVYDVAVSLDGFISGPDGDISTFPADGDHLQPYLDRLAAYETVIMGRRTYEFGYRFGLQPGARAYPHMDHYVFSRSLSLPETADVTAVREDWAGALADLRNANGGDIYLCGGGAFAGLVANLGLLDLVRLKIAPVAIGSGVRLFEGLTAPLRFERVALTPHANGVTFAEYRLATSSPAAAQSRAG